MESTVKSIDHPEHSKTDILDFIKMDPTYFVSLPSELRDEYEIALTACQYDIDNYKHISAKLKSSEIFLLKLIQDLYSNKNDEFNKLRFNRILLDDVEPKLKDNDKIFEAVIHYWKGHPNAFHIKTFSKRIKNDKKSAKLLTSIYPHGFLDFGNDVKNDLNMATMVCLKNPYIFSQYSSEHPFIQDGSLLQSIYKHSVAFFQYIVKHHNETIPFGQTERIVKETKLDKLYWLKQFHKTENFLTKTDRVVSIDSLYALAHKEALNTVCDNLTPSQIKEIVPLTDLGMDIISSKRLTLIEQEQKQSTIKKTTRKQIKLKSH